MRAMHWFVLRGNSGPITISISCMFVAVADGFTFGHGASDQDIGIRAQDIDSRVISQLGCLLTISSGILRHRQCGSVAFECNVLC